VNVARVIATVHILFCRCGMESKKGNPLREELLGGRR
jgi:hypothetical protein